MKKKTTEGVHHSITFSIETAAMTVMAVPILMDCSKAPRKQTTELKVKELKNSIGNSSLSNGKKELIQVKKYFILVFIFILIAEFNITTST